jgi:hypothetical protein
MDANAVTRKPARDAEDCGTSSSADRDTRGRGKKFAALWHVWVVLNGWTPRS